MVWDLGKAMRKKEEFESARLMDFEFRQRVRAARLLARTLGLDEAAFGRETVSHGDEDIVALAAEASGKPVSDISAEYARCSAAARAELIAERGDPTPYRLG